jgi:hypothetical protein
MNRDYSSKRSHSRSHTIQVVLKAQETMRREGISNKDYINNVLSRLSEEESKDSIRFAIVMRHADMLGVIGTTGDKFETFDNLDCRKGNTTHQLLLDFTLKIANVTALSMETILKSHTQLEFKKSSAFHY